MSETTAAPRTGIDPTARTATHSSHTRTPTQTQTETGSRSGAPTRALLACGIVAGPLYCAVAGLQMAIRDGFDLRRHALSLLSNGDLGWIQITNFVVTGLLVVAGAVGLRRAMGSGRGWRWAPRLVATYGVGLIAAGAFVADPMDGFPRGAPAGAADVSWHGMLHFLAGLIGFVALIAACFVVARRWAGQGQPGWALYSATTGVLFAAAFAGLASGSGLAWLNVAFAVAVVLGWAWLGLTAGRLMTRSTTAHRTRA